MKKILLTLFLTLFSANISYADCLIIKDYNSKREIFKEGDCNKKVSPCSTFKIPLALMGYDSDILINEEKPLINYKIEYNATIPSHKQDQTPKAWMKNSAVWYSKEIIKKLGTDKIRKYLKIFSYGNQEINQDNLTNFWLGSSLEISPEEQVTFLEDIVSRKFKISDKAYDTLLKIMPVAEDSGWKIYGKTGSCLYENDTKQIGWFIGIAEKNNRKLIFARYLDKIDNDGRVIATVLAKNDIIKNVKSIHSKLNEKVETIQELKGGSGDSIFKVKTEEYVIKFINSTEGSFKNELYNAQFTSDNSLSPKIHAFDDKERFYIMDFLHGQKITIEQRRNKELYVALADLLKKYIK